MPTAPPLGCDLSHHNPSVDFGTLKGGGVEFVGLKATEGIGFVDPTFADRRARAALVGFHRVLLYHFVRPQADAKLQALHFARVVGRLAPHERLVLDVEGPGWEDLDEPAALVAEIVFHLKTALGLRAADVMLYLSPRWARGAFGAALGSLTFMPLWAARYGAAPGDVSPWPQATVWQFTQEGRVPGASGPVDLDRWLGAEAWA